MEGKFPLIVGGLAGRRGGPLLTEATMLGMVTKPLEATWDRMLLSSLGKDPPGEVNCIDGLLSR